MWVWNRQPGRGRGRPQSGHEHGRWPSHEAVGQRPADTTNAAAADPPCCDHSLHSLVSERRRGAAYQRAKGEKKRMKSREFTKERHTDDKPGGC